MSKFSDKFLNMLRIDDEGYDDYDDFDNDDLDEEVAEQPVIKRTKKESPIIETPKKDNKEYIEEQPQRSGFRANKQSKVVPMSSSRGKSNMEVCVIKPSTVEDSREITDTLLSGRAVILNLEGLHVEIAQRIIDFASGSCYSIKGNLQKVSNYIFIITPESVDISGDFQELLGGGFDVAAFK